MTVSLVANIARPISSAISTAFSADSYGVLSSYGLLGAAASPDAVIEALFANSEVGAWYDPSDLTTMFQDRAGTTPVTADGQTVGKILDKSGRGNHAVAPSDAARPLYKTGGGLHWIQFDGIDDSLVTSSFAWGTNKSTVVVGVLNNNSSAFGLPFVFGSDPIVDAGAFGSYVNIAANGDYAIAAKGSSHCYLKTDGASIPRTDVATFTYDLSETIYSDSLKLRINAASASLTFVAGGNLGGGDFGTYPINIGRRGDNSSFLVGNIYSVVIRGALSTTQEISDTETWIADKTGVTL